MASPEQIATPEQEPVAVSSTPDKPPASTDFPAPPGWQKKIASTKKGTPSRRDVYFVAPDGEELKSKRALEQYLKKHPGGPAASEFDWGLGETPTRRSSRLSSKARPSPDTPETGSGGKRQRRKAKEEEDSKDEEMVEPEPPADVPSTEEKKDEVMEGADKTEEVKTTEDVPAPAIDGKENGGDEKAGAVEKPLSEPTAEVSEANASANEEKKEDPLLIPTEEKEAGEKCQESQVGQIDAGKETESDKGDVSQQQQPKEESDKISSGCQQCPEAQNASRPVGVST